MGKETVEANRIGLYQFSSSLGIVAIFIRQMGYGEAFEGLEVGSEAFDKKWKEMAQNPQFAESQHVYIQNHYYQPQMNFLSNHRHTAK